MSLFLASFLAVAQKVALLFLLILIGYLCGKLRILTEEANKSLADIVMYFVTPAVIINAFSATLYERTEILGILKNIGIVAAVSVVIHALMILLVTVFFRSGDENFRKVMRFAAVFSNAGYIALPLAQALIDTPESHKGALYAAVYLAVFNIVLWTWGYSDMSREKNALNLKKILTSAGVIGVTIGLFFFTSPLWITVRGQPGIVLPELFRNLISSMSALNLPLPMFMVGYYLTKVDLLRSVKDSPTYLCCMCLRLLIFPLLCLGLMLPFGIRGNVLTVCVIGASAPVGATTTIFSAKFSRDPELSVRLVSLSTILSMFTMPLVVGLTQMLA